MTRVPSRLTVGSVRGERGQTATELLGMLLVVTVIIAAVSTSKAGALIKSQSARIVCQIGGGDCAVKPVAQLAHAASAQPSGPPIGGGRPITVLPFPGSVGVACTYDERSPNICKGSDANGAG